MKEVHETNLIDRLRQQIQAVEEGRLGFNVMEDTIGGMTRLKEIDPNFVDLLEDIIRLADVEDYHIFRHLSLICDRINDSQIDYEALLQQYPPQNTEYGADERVAFLVQRTQEISSPEKVRELLDHFSERYSYGVKLSDIIHKSTHCIENLERFLTSGKFLSAEEFSVILSNMDAMVDDKEVAQTIVSSAVRDGNVALLGLLEEKSCIEIDYSPALLQAIECKNKEMMKALLDRGADVNYVGFDSNGNHVHVLDLIVNEFKGEEEALITDFMHHGANLSLMRLKGGQEAVIEILQKQADYKKLEEYLPQFPLQILHRGFVKDDARIIKMAMENGFLDVNAKNNIADYGYSSFQEEGKEQLPLPFALRNGKGNISRFLIEAKAEIGDFPVFEYAIQTHNNLILQALCNHGYDCNQKIADPYRPDETIHPLEYAFLQKNAQGARLLLENMNAQDINALNDRLLGYLIVSELDKAVKEELFQTMCDKGLALEIVPEKNTHFLFSACRSGTPGIVKYLHNLGYDMNERFDKHVQGDNRASCVNEAIEKGQDDILAYLLQNNVEVDGNTLLLAVEKNTRIDLLQAIITTTTNINETNYEGHTAIHLAAKFGNKEVFDLVVAHGLHPLMADREGNNAYCLAAYYGTNEALGISPDHIPFDMDAFQDNLKLMPGSKSSDVNEYHCTYAAKFSCLFDNAEQLQGYFNKYKSDDYQALHDLAQFSFPKNKNFTKEVWRDLAMEHGLAVTKHLFLAETIEAHLGRPPESFDEIQTQARFIKYPRASENPAMANIFHDNTITEDAFNHILDSYHPKTEDHIPDIFIEGSTFGHDRFYMKKLAPGDLRGFILGNKTNCCQYVGAQGSECAEHGMASPNGGFYVVFQRAKPGRVENVERWLDSLDNAVEEEEFIRSLQDKKESEKDGKVVVKYKNTATSIKYQGKISKIKEELRNQNVADDFEKVKPVLRKEFSQELEGEIVAQSWVWLSKNNNLVLDSWERLREQDNFLLKPFMKQLSQEVLSREGDIKKVLIGDGGYTPKGFAVVSTDNPETPRDYNGYRDSKHQFLIAEKNVNEPIKFNNALGIEDSRVEALKDNFVEDQDHEYQDGDKARKNLEILKRSQKSWRERHQDRRAHNSDMGR